MINFSTMQALDIPEGKVVEIKDASGRVIWALQEGFDGTLRVEKITSNTYASEKTYTNEKFILLDIYPKTNGTVSVTYGGLTKTITDTSGAEKPNSRKVFFGTFNGVSDEVETPDSGILTIEGDLYAFGCGSYSTSSKNTARCGCVTAIGNWEQLGITEIPAGAFLNCSPLKGAITIPDMVNSIGNSAFANCSRVESITILSNCDIGDLNPFYGISDKNILILGDNVTNPRIEGNALMCRKEAPELYPNENWEHALVSGFSDTIIPNDTTVICDHAFFGCNGLVNITIPSNVRYIKDNAFLSCNNLQTVTFLGTTPPFLGRSTTTEESAATGFFPSGCTFVVPKGCVSTYTSHMHFKVFADRIVEES